jgi:hypothetical protein
VRTLAEVTEAAESAVSAACIDAFSTLSAEPAASDSAAPKTATAAAEMVSFLACTTSQGRSRRIASTCGSLRGVSASCAVPVSAWVTGSATTVSASAGMADFFTLTRQGCSRDVSAAGNESTDASAAPRARASCVSTESETGIGNASAIGCVTSSRSASAPTR